MSPSVVVPRRFNGPLASGNGGYSAGAFAAFLPEGPAEVDLRRPVPLDTPLEVVRDGQQAVRVVSGDALVGEARSVPRVEVDVPTPVDPSEARAAAARYRGTADGPFSRCFVCGRARPDAFRVFAGAVEGRQLVASPWTPAAWTADRAGDVHAEFVWAVLDCPTYFAAYAGEDLALGVLARLTARIDAPVRARREHFVIAWPIATDGRKRHAGSAIVAADGAVLAVGRALLVEPRAE